MIVVLASRMDPEARALVEAWSGFGAVLLSAEDLTTPGWEFQPADPGAGTAVVDGRRIRVASFRAVLTRRPAVLVEELRHMDPADRSYVAAETNAFLVAWLTALPCTVVNRPTPTSLCGPAWDELHWRVAAAGAGMDWAEADETEIQRVVVCGAQCLFARTPKQATIARALARTAGVDLLGVSFRGDRVCGASVAPALEDPDVRQCLLSHLLGSA